MFGTNANLDLMVQSENWFADGTFKVTPPLFAQLYTIHRVRYNNVIPSVFVLMPNREMATYARVLAALKHLKPELDPVTVRGILNWLQFVHFVRSFQLHDYADAFFISAKTCGVK